MNDMNTSRWKAAAAWLMLMAAAMLSACGDPMLDLSGSEQQKTDSLSEVISSWEPEDQMTFLLWYRAKEEQDKLINGHKASEIISLVREEIRQAEVSEALGEDRYNNWLNHKGLSGFGFSNERFFDECREKDNSSQKSSFDSLSAPLGRSSSNFAEEKKEAIRRNKALIEKVDFTCAVNPEDPKSAIVTIKNRSDKSIVAYAVGTDGTDQFFREIYSIPGGLISGEEKSFAVPHLGDRINAGYDCYLRLADFYYPNSNFSGDKLRIVVGSEYPDQMIPVWEMPDYPQFKEERTAAYMPKLTVLDKSEVCRDYLALHAKAESKVTDILKKAKEVNGGTRK